MNQKEFSTELEIKTGLITLENKVLLRMFCGLLVESTWRKILENKDYKVEKDDKYCKLFQEEVNE